MNTIRRRRRGRRAHSNSNNRRSNEYQSDRGETVWLIFRFNRHGHRDWFKIRNQFQFFDKQHHQQRNHCIIQRNRQRIELRPMLIAGTLNPIKTSLTATGQPVAVKLIIIVQKSGHSAGAVCDIFLKLGCTIAPIKAPAPPQMTSQCTWRLNL